MLSRSTPKADKGQLAHSTGSVLVPSKALVILFWEHLVISTSWFSAQSTRSPHCLKFIASIDKTWELIFFFKTRLFFFGLKLRGGG